jgi:hypothetical protein
MEKGYGGGDTNQPVGTRQAHPGFAGQGRRSRRDHGGRSAESGRDDQKEIAESRKHHATDEVEQDVRAHGDRDDKEHEGIEAVSFSTRAYPLLEMLRAARDEKADVMWGVL